MEHPENIQLKYPVVLVHGIGAHDRKGPVKFWGRIPQMLENKNLQVFRGNTDAWGNYESNALLLKETIEKILLDTKKEKVNIIAHSKGGIDSRFFIWKHNFAEKIASLTTICTPHHGSEIADLLHKQKIVHTKFSKKALRIFGSIYGDINPDLYAANSQLTTENMKKFNRDIVLDKKVYHQSFYTTMKNAFDDVMFFYSYLYLKKTAGKNDGVVSARSAEWGDNIVHLANGVSHGEILDLKMKTVSGIHIPGLYLDIIKNLEKKGF